MSEGDFAGTNLSLSSRMQKSMRSALSRERVTLYKPFYLCVP